MSQNYSKKLDNRKILMLNPQSTDERKVLNVEIEHFQKSFKEFGVDSIICNLNDPNINAVLKQVCEKEKLIHFGAFGFDTTYNNQENLFDHYNIPNFALLGDHIYAEFMRSRMRSMSPHTNVVSRINDTLEELKILRTDVKKMHLQNPHTLIPLAQVKEYIKPTKQRTYDILITWNVVKTKASIANLLANFRDRPELARFTEDLYERLKRNDDVYSITHFTQALEKEFGLTSTIKFPWSKDIMFLLDVLHHVDFIVRTEARLNVLKDIKKLSPKLKIGILIDSGPDLGHPGVEYIGGQSFTDMVKIMGDSKTTLDMIPTYKNAAQERITTACSVGCIPITKSNPMTEKHFSNGESIIYTESCFELPADIYDRNDKEWQNISDGALGVANDNFELTQATKSYLDLFADQLKDFS